MRAHSPNPALSMDVHMRGVKAQSAVARRVATRIRAGGVGGIVANACKAEGISTRTWTRWKVQGVPGCVRVDKMQALRSCCLATGKDPVATVDRFERGVALCRIHGEFKRHSRRSYSCPACARKSNRDIGRLKRFAELGAWLRDARHGAGLTLIDVSRAIGANYGPWETGSAPPVFGRARTAARVLKVPIDEMLRRDNACRERWGIRQREGYA